MSEQAAIVEVGTQAYKHEGMIYVIHGNRLFQVDHNHFVEFMAGTDFYGWKIRQLKKTTPIPYSDLKFILSNLKKTIEEIL